MGMEAEMKLWSIQSDRVWKALCKKGRYRTYRSYIDPWWWKHFEFSYTWMREQMQKRIGPPPVKNLLPVWAWAHWRGNKGCTKDKPDLRALRFSVEKGQYHRIELEVAASRVLLSDFEAWHMVLNHSYVSLSEKEYDEFYAKVKKHPWPKHLERKMHKSWERIFNMEAGDPEWNGKPEEKSVQACLWEIRLDDVKKTTPFVGMGKR